MREVGFNEQQPVYGYNPNSQYSNGYHSGNQGYGFHPPLIQASNGSQGMDGYQPGHAQYNEHYGPPAQYGGYPNHHHGYGGNSQSQVSYDQNPGAGSNTSIPPYVNYDGQQLPVVMLSSPNQSQGEQNSSNQGYGSQQGSGTYPESTGNSNPQIVTYTQQWTFPPGAEIPANLPGYPPSTPSTAATGSGTGQSAYPITTNSGTGAGQSAYPNTINSGNGTGQSQYPATGAGTPTGANGGTAASSVMALYGMLNSFSQYLSQAMTTLGSMMSGQQGSQTNSGTGGLLTGGTTGTGTATTGQGMMGQGGYTSLGAGQQSQTQNIQQLPTLLEQAIAQYQAGSTSSGRVGNSNSSALQSLIAQATNQAGQGTSSSQGSNTQQQQQVLQLLALIQQAQGAANSGSQSPTYSPQTSLATSGVTGGTGGVDLSNFLSSLAQMADPGTAALTGSATPSTSSSSSQPNALSQMLSNNIYQYSQNQNG